MIRVGRNRGLLHSGGLAFGSRLDRCLVRDEIGVWFGADRRLGRSLIGVWFADRRLVCFVIGVWIVLSLARSLFYSLSSFFLWLSLSLLRV